LALSALIGTRLPRGFFLKMLISLSLPTHHAWSTCCWPEIWYNPVRIKQWPILRKQAAVLCRVKADEHCRTIGSANECRPGRRSYKFRSIGNADWYCSNARVVSPQLVWRSAPRCALVLVTQQDDICGIDSYLHQHRIKQNCHCRPPASTYAIDDPM
jgi:hypothetical protein